MRPAADAPPPMKVWRAHLAYLNTCRLIGGGTFIVNLHGPDGRVAPPPMKVWRAHLAYLNTCRLIGGGFS